MTADQTKARRGEVRLGNLIIDGFQLPDGSYRMSQQQVSECIGDDPVYARRFLGSATLKALQGEGYTPDTFEILPTEQVRGQTRFQGWTLPVAYAYWVYRCHKGNKQAFSLVIALGTEGLERRFDSAFGVTRTEDDRNTALETQIATLTAQIAQAEKDLGRAFGEVLEAEAKAEYMAEQLRREGIEPFALPEQPENDYP